ncbi:MAG: lysophospholipid acyltransferase family protein [Nocardioidaceae bacterium]
MSGQTEHGDSSAPTGLGMSGAAPWSWKPARFVAQRLLLRPLVWSVTSVEVTGQEHLRELDGPFVVAANHSSHLDAPLVLCALPWRLGVRTAVGAAADYFFDARWRAAVTGVVFNAFPVDRQGGRARPGVAAELLDEGIPLLVFPEGTRSKDGQMHRFKPGAAALAVSRDVPVLPVGLRGAYDAMPRGRNWPVRGRPRIHVAFGAPLQPEPGESALALTARLSEVVRSLLEPPEPKTQRDPRGSRAS